MARSLRRRRPATRYQALVARAWGSIEGALLPPALFRFQPVEFSPEVLLGLPETEPGALGQQLLSGLLRQHRLEWVVSSPP